MAYKYLDYTGLGRLWAAIKNKFALKTEIPTSLFDLSEDSTHRLVTDAEKSTWNNKSNFSGSYNDLLNKPAIPSAVTEATVTGWGFTKNIGTYSKPTDGIPKTDLDSSVQTSLNKAESALQSHQDISGKQDKTNLVTSLSALSDDAHYPSAKCVYDIVGDIESAINAIRGVS